MSGNSFEVKENDILYGHEGLYIVDKFLGEGTFGKVAKCRNLLTSTEVAIKIIKKGYVASAENEIKALIEASKIDCDKYNVIKYIEWFRYQSHVCIVFEILDQSLFDFMEDRGFRPLSLQDIRVVAFQLLVALKGLKKANLVHCDIKLDNIMLVDRVSKPFELKLIDLGLARKTEDMLTGSRIQNICFRAPEVMLGLPLDERVDMWTVGYVLACLYTGNYILPEDSEYNILRALVEMQGMPDDELLEEAIHTDKFFTPTQKNSKVVWKLDTPQQQSIKTGIQVQDNFDSWSFDELRGFYADEKKAREVKSFVDLLKRMLEVDPNKRISVNRALKHRFFKLKRMQPKTTKPQEPAAVEVHQEVTSVPQGPEANPQQRSTNTNKTSLVQEQQAPAATQKRKQSDRQSQDPEDRWQIQPDVKKKKF